MLYIPKLIFIINFILLFLYVYLSIRLVKIGIFFINSSLSRLAPFFAYLLDDAPRSASRITVRDLSSRYP